MSRLKQRYQKEVIPAMNKEYAYPNVMAIPKLEKIVINMGLGEAVDDSKVIDVAVNELALISGQKPIITRSRKSIEMAFIRHPSQEMTPL